MSTGVGDSLTGDTATPPPASPDAVAPPPDGGSPDHPCEEQHALSLGQEQIWLHSRLISDASGHNETFTITHRGPLDPVTLGNALTDVIRRHEAWRTTFSEVEGGLVAFIHEPAAVRLPVVDLRSLPSSARETELRSRTAEASIRSFDLGRGPLCRFILYELDDELQRLDVTIHQIIVDRVSVYEVFLPELARTYQDLVSGGSPTLPDLPLQYRDFVRSQTDTAGDEIRRQHLEYWRGHLAQDVPALDLPTDRTRPAVQPDIAEDLAFAFPEALDRALRVFALSEGVPLFDTLLTCFAIVLSRRSGDEIQTIGTVISLRKSPELGGILGYFLNTLALRVDLSGDPTFREALHRVRDVVSDGVGHGSVPIHQVLQAIAPQRDPSRSPLFQAMLTIEPPLPEPPAGWEASPQALDTGRSWVDLHMRVEDRSDRLLGRLRYPTALFDLTTVEALVAQWIVLVQGALRDPDRPIGDLALLTDPERAALSSARNRVEAAAPFERFTPDEVAQTIASRFAQQVARHADRIAVTDGEREWSYRALDEESEALARAILASSSDGPRRVGILGQPGGRLITAVVAILKAGAAYVPLDPQAPPNRIRFVGEDARLDLVIADDGLDGLAREAFGTAIPILAISARADAPAVTAIERATPTSPAWLLYTSGSTGQPKGVMQTQRNVLHAIRVYTNSLHLNAADRLLLVAKPTFVASIYPLFGALLNGATVCVVDLAVVGFDGLREAMVDRRITIYHSVPTVYRELVGTLATGERLADVRAVMLGGEEVRTADLDAFRRHFAADAVFINVMGSTESSMALQFFADPTTVIQGATVPVGYPVEATEALLLDPYGRSSDFVGEIAIRSRHVAPGYWRHPELDGAFSADAEDPGLITYRTGDRARRRPDGSLEFQGRRDRQIKIRGMRVETAEIERALAALPSVRLGAVEARSIDGRIELVAYAEPSGTERPSQHQLRTALREELPEYMIPSVVIWIEQMPRTSSNKIDRRVLPTPTAEALAISSVEPQDALERRLVVIWEQLLSRHPIRVDDDFFDLGGHSLVAARMFDRIWRETGQRIPLSVLLEGATIAHVAARMREGLVPERSGLVTVQPSGTRPPLFVVPGAGSRVLYLRNVARHIGPDQPVYALHQPPTAAALRAGRLIEDLAAEYVAAVRKVQPSGPYRLLGYSFGGAVAYEIAQQLIAAGQTVSYLALIDSRSPGSPAPRRRPHWRNLPRRMANQVSIVRLLGPHEGARYLRTRTSIAFENALGSERDSLDRRLPTRLRPLLWRDRTPAGEREWMAADRAAHDRYHPSPYPGRITFLEARHKEPTIDGVELWQGWADLASGGLDLRRIPGNHLTTLVEPLASITVTILAEALRQAGDDEAIRDGAGSHGLLGEMPAAATLP